MAQTYSNVTQYVTAARSLLQDLVPPYRYSDADIVSAINHALSSIERLRPDIFLDLKYQRPLRKGDTDDGMPPSYSVSDIAFLSDGVTYDPSNGTMVPLPGKYRSSIDWYVGGWLQLYDVADAQDQRAGAFLQKFEHHLLALSAA